MKTHEPTMTGTKVCTKCQKELPVICFAVCKSNKDGLCNSCRECVKEKVKMTKGTQSGRQGIGKRQLRQMEEYHKFHNPD